ncbi:MAG: hypothetical protein ABJO01_10070 [Parasphingorhabdus sp.]|uniref:hypothetical protein n=1 Tax=Parasphingorhabdus sp. TaxID=2709688 RepID=UPI00329A621B
MSSNLGRRIGRIKQHLDRSQTREPIDLSALTDRELSLIEEIFPKIAKHGSEAIAEIDKRTRYELIAACDKNPALYPFKMGLADA